MGKHEPLPPDFTRTSDHQFQPRNQLRKTMAPMTVLAKAQASAATFQPRRAAQFLGTPVRCAVPRRSRISAASRLVVLAADTEEVIVFSRSVLVIRSPEGARN